MITICDTYNIFTELKPYLKNDLYRLKKEGRSNYTVDKFIENKKLKELCIKDI